MHHGHCGVTHAIASNRLYLSVICHELAQALSISSKSFLDELISEFIGNGQVKAQVTVATCNCCEIVFESALKSGQRHGIIAARAACTPIFCQVLQFAGWVFHDIHLDIAAADSGMFVANGQHALKLILLEGSFDLSVIAPAGKVLCITTCCC